MTRTTNHLAGTRLKYHEVVTAEGDRAWDGFYDSLTGEDCSAAFAGDGKMRCVPRSRFETQVFYTDAACSDPVYLKDATCDHKYLELFDRSVACMPQVQLFAPGAAYTGPTFQAGPSGTCVPNTTPNLTFARKGALVDPSTLAEVEPAQLPEPGRIARVGYKSADGAFMVSGYHDTQLDIDCNFGLLRDGKQHCYPRFNNAPEFSDAMCQTTLLGVSTACGVKPDLYFSRSSQDGCNAGTIAVKADQPFTGQEYERDPADGSCAAVPSGASPDLTLYTSVDLPDSAVPEIAYTTVDSDPGRLKPMYRTATDGSCSFYDFWDSELKIACTFLGDPESGYSCYPDVGSYNLDKGFSDAGCSVAVDYLSEKTCFASQVPKYIVTWTYGDCGARTQSARQVGAGVVGAAAALFVGAPGNCSPIVVDPDSTYFTVGPALPPSTFVSGQRAPL